jgi:dTDP-4-amino-4,6-dideoxygalactose transaminase
MNWKIPLAQVSFNNAEKDAVLRILESGWISMGPETERFEEEFARYVGAKHAVAVSSGTAALHLALAALGIGPGDEVIVPSLTFVATANAVLYVGAKPIFADISGPGDLNVSPEEIRRKITSRTRALIVMHYGGYPCRMDLISGLAREHDLKIVEDAAHAPGSVFQGRNLGTWGDMGCFSYFANKNMTTGEGGMVVTDNQEQANRIRTLRSHGMTSLTWDRHRGHSFSYDVVATGFNYRIDEIRAAIGRTQLAGLDENNRKRRAATRTMREMLKEFGDISVPFPEEWLDRSSCHIMPILLREAGLREHFMASLKQWGVQTSVHYPPVHRFSAYRHQFPASLPRTEDIAEREVTLPLFPEIRSEQIAYIGEAIGAALRQ